MPIEKMVELAERCEAADEGDFGLREEIAFALGWKRKQVGQVFAWYSPGSSQMNGGPPDWLESFNDAMTLLDQWKEHPEWQIKRRYCTGYHASVGIGAETVGCDTPARALTAACLRALAVSL